MPEGKNYVLIIAPWGNFLGWGDARYSIEDEDITVESTTSLAAVLRKYIEKEKDNVKALVIVPETIMCPWKSYKKYKEYDGITLSELVSGDIDDERLEGRYLEALNSLKKVVRKYVKEKICGKIGLDDKCSKIFDFLIAPNIGEYKCSDRKDDYIGRWSIDKSIRGADISSHYGGLLVLKSLQILDNMGVFCRRGSSVDIVVDATHGINYMPLMTYRAASYIARLVAAATGGEATITLYNSDPYPQGVENPSLTIHLVEEEKYRGDRAVQRLVYTYASRRENLGIDKIIKIAGSRELVEFKKEIKELDIGEYMRRGIKYFDGYASAIHYSLPLSLISVYHEDRQENCELQFLINEFSKFINYLIDHLYPKIDSVENRYINITYKVILDYDYVKAFTSIIGLKGYSEYVYNSIECKGTLYTNGKLYVEVNTLEEVLEKYLRGPHNLTSRNEIGQIKQLIKYIRRGEDPEKHGIHNPLKEILAELKEKNEVCRHSRLDKRNFIAHGGLSRDNICIRRSGETYYLGYGDLEEVLKTLKDAFDELISFLK